MTFILLLVCLFGLLIFPFLVLVVFVDGVQQLGPARCKSIEVWRWDRCEGCEGMQVRGLHGQGGVGGARVCRCVWG